jgi:hypothetical protein
VQARYADNTLSGISNVISITVPREEITVSYYEGFEACEAVFRDDSALYHLDLDGSSTWNCSRIQISLGK